MVLQGHPSVLFLSCTRSQRAGDSKQCARGGVHPGLVDHRGNTKKQTRTESELESPINTYMFLMCKPKHLNYTDAGRQREKVYFHHNNNKNLANPEASCCEAAKWTSAPPRHYSVKMTQKILQFRIEESLPCIYHSMITVLFLRERFSNIWVIQVFYQQGITSRVEQCIMK